MANRSPLMLITPEGLQSLHRKGAKGNAKGRKDSISRQAHAIGVGRIHEITERRGTALGLGILYLQANPLCGPLRFLGAFAVKRLTPKDCEQPLSALVVKQVFCYRFIQ